MIAVAGRAAGIADLTDTVVVCVTDSPILSTARRPHLPPYSACEGGSYARKSRKMSRTCGDPCPTTEKPPRVRVMDAMSPKRGTQRASAAGLVRLGGGIRVIAAHETRILPRA